MSAAPILILESNDSSRLGDLSLYRSMADAEKSLEATDVLNNEYFGYTLDGRALVLGVEGGNVSIAIDDKLPAHLDTVRKLLEE